MGESLERPSFCSRCGSPLGGDDAFCAACGAPVGSLAVPSGPGGPLDAGSSVSVATLARELASDPPRTEGADVPVCDAQLSVAFVPAGDGPGPAQAGRREELVGRLGRRRVVYRLGAGDSVWVALSDEWLAASAAVAVGYHKATEAQAAALVGASELASDPRQTGGPHVAAGDVQLSAAYVPDVGSGAVQAGRRQELVRRLDRRQVAYRVGAGDTVWVAPRDEWLAESAAAAVGCHKATAAEVGLQLARDDADGYQRAAGISGRPAVSAAGETRPPPPARSSVGSNAATAASLTASAILKLVTAAAVIAFIVWGVSANQNSARVQCAFEKAFSAPRSLPEDVTCLLNGNF